MAMGTMAVGVAGRSVAGRCVALLVVVAGVFVVGGRVLLLMVAVAVVVTVRAVLLLRRPGPGVVMATGGVPAVPFVLAGRPLLARLSRRNVRVALARGMRPVTDRASARRVAATPERPAGREALGARATLLDGRRDRGCRLIAMARGLRRRRRRRGGRRSSRPGLRAVAGRRRRPPANQLGLVRRAARGLRGNVADRLTRRAGGGRPRRGSRRRVLRDRRMRRPPRARGRRRHDHLRRRRRAGA